MKSIELKFLLFFIIIFSVSIHRLLAQESTSTLPVTTPASTSSPSLNSISFDINQLTFIPDLNNFKIKTPEVTYSVDQNSDQEGEITISDAIFNENTFKILSGPFLSLKTFLDQKNVSKNNFKLDDQTPILFITSPRFLIPKGSIEVLSEDGSTLFNKVIEEENISLGNRFAEQLKPTFWGTVSNPTQLQTHILFYSNEFNLLFLNPNKKSGVRICWIRNESPYYSRYCTPYYRFSKKENQLVLQTQTASTKVLINQKEVSLTGAFKITTNKDIRFLAISSRGYSIEFFSRAPELNLVDFYAENENSEWFFLFGHTDFPVGRPVKHFPFVKPNSFTSYFRWEATIGPTYDYWVTPINRSEKNLTVSGQGGGLFLFPIEFNKVPTQAMKLKLVEPLTSTYSKAPIIKGLNPKAFELQSQTPEKIKMSKSGKAFLWELQAPEVPSINKNDLVVVDKISDSQNPQDFTASYSIFRGYSGEFSLRVAGALTPDGKINFLGEAAYNQWFESLLGWNNDLFSRQRWGISLRHFKPFNIKNSPVPIQLTTLDIKYRLSKGLWERDETWGLIFGMEDVYISNVHGAFSGIGFFWARSMPKIFDDIANWFPFMEYPKWVDMEMIYYPAPMLATIQVGTSPTYSINFHGKVLWSKNIFGEAGFGVKGYSYITNLEDKHNQDSVEINAFYGTAGLGINF